MYISEIEELLRKIASIRSESFFLPKTTEQDIRKYEKEHGIAFPQELCEWLYFCNGTSLVDGNFLGINRNDEPYLEIIEGYAYKQFWKEKGWIPIGEDGCGDFYVLDTKNRIKEFHPVYFVDQADYFTPDYVVASSLLSFLKFKITDSILYFQHVLEYFWPFDKEKVLAEDPDIALCVTAPLPWDSD
jgi:cell wall assembly regulator SMI1